MHQVISALEEAPLGLSLHDLTHAVNIRYMRLQQTLKILALESPAPIVQQEAKVKWQLTPIVLPESFWERVDHLTELRKGEQRQMQEGIRVVAAGSHGISDRGFGWRPACSHSARGNF